MEDERTKPLDYATPLPVSKQLIQRKLMTLGIVIVSLLCIGLGALLTWGARDVGALADEDLNEWTVSPALINLCGPVMLIFGIACGLVVFRRRQGKTGS